MMFLTGHGKIAFPIFTKQTLKKGSYSPAPLGLSFREKFENITKKGAAYLPLHNIPL